MSGFNNFARDINSCKSVSDICECAVIFANSTVIYVNTHDDVCKCARLFLLMHDHIKKTNDLIRDVQDIWYACIEY